MEENIIQISVIIPIFNEQEILPELYERLKKAVDLISPDYELIFIDDGSKDHSLEELIKLNLFDQHVKYISFSRNFGHQISVTAGLVYCRGKAVVIIDGDLQDPPELIPAMYGQYQKGFKVVYAKRIKRKGETFFKKATAKIFYRLLNSITSVDIPLDTGDFRLIDRDIVEYLKQMPEQSKFYRGQVAWLGFKQSFVEFEREQRKAGTTGYTFKKMLKFAIDGITAFSDSPLKLVTRLGLFVFCFSIIVIFYALYSYFILNRVISGWTSLIISTMFIGGIQLLSIGIIGEYISRINNNVRNRPLYIVEKTNIDKSHS